MSRQILHVDLDAFYASVEERENPALKGKPVIIGADPKQGKGRGVVVACSYEARRRGIHSGQPISVAYRTLPDGIYLRPDLETYADVSSDIMVFLRRYADRFEQASIDEAYMDVSQSAALYGGSLELAWRIKNELKKIFDLTCSVGIAPNKSAAKIASDMHKPDGLTIIEENQIRETLASLPVSKISGIGHKTEQKLNKIGINTIGDLAKASPKSLYEQFGKIAVWLWAIANGEERVEVQENFEMKSIGAEHTFEVDTNNWTSIDKELVALTEDIHSRLAEAHMAFRTVALKIRFKGFVTYTRSKSLKFSSTQKATVSETIRELCTEFKRTQKEVRLVGVRLSGLGPASAAPLEAFTKRS